MSRLSKRNHLEAHDHAYKSQVQSEFGTPRVSLHKIQGNQHAILTTPYFADPYFADFVGMENMSARSKLPWKTGLVLLYIQG